MSPALPSPVPRDNHLLALLPHEDFERLLPRLMPYSFTSGQLLYPPGRLMELLYFPVTTVMALIYTMADGTTAAMALTGHEGAVGTALYMGATSSPMQAIIQVSGVAFGLSAAFLEQEFRRGGAFQRVLLHYTQALTTQIAQTAVCNQLHTVGQRLRRWLLLMHDRVLNDVIPLTHEGFAQMLGVRRASVTMVLRHLQELGLLHSRHGRIHIIDRQGLEATVCECYQVVQTEYAHLLA
ncbi:MAG: Crp/Fnr family transcriptional regulator [Candidatus Tectimicrobiota bacterium]